MSLAEQIQLINDGLFDPEHDPIELEQVLDNGTHRAVNWRRIRPAIEALQQMTWCQLDSQWDFFMDEERYPVGRPMDLRPDETETFQNLVQNLVDEIQEGVRILSSVHPKISLTDVTVTIESTELQTIEKAIEHVRRTTELAAIDDAITVSKIQAGSIDIIFTAGKASLLGLQLAILLANLWKSPQTRDKIRPLRRLFKRAKPDDDVDDETVTEIVMEETRETFWESAHDHFEQVVKNTGKPVPEAQNKVNLAAREIHDKSEQVSANWKLPPAIVHGLPGGITVSLNYNDPESIGRVIRELASPPETTDDST